MDVPEINEVQEEKPVESNELPKSEEERESPKSEDIQLSKEMEIDTSAIDEKPKQIDEKSPNENAKEKSEANDKGEEELEANEKIQDQLEATDSQICTLLGDVEMQETSKSKHHLKENLGIECIDDKVGNLLGHLSSMKYVVRLFKFNFTLLSTECCQNVHVLHYGVNVREKFRG